MTILSHVHLAPPYAFSGEGGHRRKTVKTENILHISLLFNPGFEDHSTAYMTQFKKFGLIITNRNCAAAFKKVSILPRSDFKAFPSFRPTDWIS